MRESWDEFFISMAKMVSTRSRDPSTKCGAVIVDNSNRVLSLGFNGFPQGVVDEEARYADRTLKYLYVAHADLNAIYSAARIGIPLVGSKMYLTGPPCNECMKGIIQVGIVELIWPKDNKFENDPETMERWKSSMQATYMMAHEAQVKLVRV